VGQHLKKLADGHFGGSFAPLLLSLLEQTTLSRNDRAAIEMMIDKLGD
jgi:hypothetical protein